LERVDGGLPIRPRGNQEYVRVRLAAGHLLALGDHHDARGDRSPEVAAGVLLVRAAELRDLADAIGRVLAGHGAIGARDGPKGVEQFQEARPQRPGQFGRPLLGNPIAEGVRHAAGCWLLVVHHAPSSSRTSEAVTTRARPPNGSTRTGASPRLISSYKWLFEQPRAVAAWDTSTVAGHSRTSFNVGAGPGVLTAFGALGI